jgi:hypothetical protein
VLVAWGVPEKRRALIDALIGASNGSTDWFEATDFEIGQRAREATNQGRSRRSIEQWTLREREHLKTWETDYGRTLVEMMPGGQAQQVNYKSQYRLANLFELAVETDAKARQSRDWEKNRKRALRKAAQELFKAKRHEFIQPANRKRFKSRKENCDLFLKLIDTYTNKLCGMAFIEGRDLAEMLAHIEFNLRQRRELLILSPQVENKAQTTGAIEDNQHGGARI